MGIKLGLGMLFTFLLFCVNAQEEGKWEFKKEKDGISIYLRDVPDSDVKELKMTSTIPGPSLTAFAALFEDLDNLENWAYANYDSRLIEQISDTEIVYYVKADFPWPMSNRDFVLHNWVGQDSTGTYYSISTAEVGFVPEEKNLVRVTSFDSSWRITQVAAGQFYIEAIIGSDPGGLIPSWLINLFIDVGPFKTVKALIVEVQKEKYVNAQLDYITEPKY